MMKDFKLTFVDKFENIIYELDLQAKTKEEAIEWAKEERDIILDNLDYDIVGFVVKGCDEK